MYRYTAEETGLGTRDDVIHDYAEQAGRLEWAVEELLSILDLNPCLKLTAGQARSVQRARN